MVWEGEGVILSARKLIGATKPLEAEPGTIRGDLAIDIGRNIIHGSDGEDLSLIHISEPTRLRRISYAVFCLKKKDLNWLD